MRNIGLFSLGVSFLIRGETMSESATSEPAISKDIESFTTDKWLYRLNELPRRAVVAFTLRRDKRHEVLRRYSRLEAEAYCGGLEIDRLRAVDWMIRHSTSFRLMEFYADYVCQTFSDRDKDPMSITAAGKDIQKLLDLKLGKPGEEGEPIRWNDPRLGPLWPDGPPQWYTETEQACRKLEGELRNMPDPDTPPDDPLLESQIEDRAWLDQLRGEGKLDKYRGEYVIAAEKQIFAHGRNLVKVHPLAEKKAQAKGITAERLILYFMPG